MRLLFNKSRRILQIMERILTKNTADRIDKETTICGWVHTRRDHGKIVFIDLRDRSGILQVVFTPDKKETYNIALLLRSEFVVEITGVIHKRPGKMVNDKIFTGAVEMEAKSIIVLNPSRTPPFELDKDTVKASEGTRLKYRYLDLRTPRMQRNLRMRHRLLKSFRKFIEEADFCEVETPYLTKGTPEGAREFIVPSRLQSGRFFVLPQSPQQFKQLLMVAGIERYYQIARCFRDEDQRGDRQAEFTQIDIEASFLKQEKLLKIIEKVVIESIQEVFPEKKISKAPFPVITHTEAMDKYNSDKPDVRKNKKDNNELAFLWVVDFPMFEYSNKEKKFNAVHHPFTSPKDEDIKLLESSPEEVKAKAYDLVLNGFEVAGGSIRIHQRDLQNKIFKILGIEEKEIASRFGHMLEAFEYGAPPHGGIAFGFDRLVAILAREPNIREVMAFPKTGDNRDLMMGAPSELPDKQLKEAHIKKDT